MIQLNLSIQKKLRALGVMSVYLFGSHAQGTSSKSSDLDLGILFHDASRVKHGVDTLPLYSKLYDILADLLPSDRDTILDIVFLQGGVSLELQANVVRNGIFLMDDDPMRRADYEAQVMVRAADFAPILQMIDSVILDRL